MRKLAFVLAVLSAVAAGCATQAGDRMGMAESTQTIQPY